MQALRYARATSVDEAVRLLRQGGETARVLAGGTDVIVQARERRRVIDLFVDIKHIPETHGAGYDPDAGLRVGAARPLYRIYGDETCSGSTPRCVDAPRSSAATAIQGRASLGGNLCNSSPAADSIPAMIALRGVANIAGPNGRREVPIEEFCTGPGRNVLQPGEFVVVDALPVAGPAQRRGWERFIPRNEMDIAVVNAALRLASTVTP